MSVFPSYIFSLVFLWGWYNFIFITVIITQSNYYLFWERKVVCSIINHHCFWETAMFKSGLYSLCQLCVVEGKPFLSWSESPSGEQTHFSSEGKMYTTFFLFLCSLLVKSGLGACPQWDILEIWSSPDTHTHREVQLRLHKWEGQSSGLICFSFAFLWTILIFIIVFL